MHETGQISAKEIQFNCESLHCCAVMSSNGETGVVLRGVTHGAVDFLIKPVRVEELRNVWQHVVRKRKGDAVSCQAGLCMTSGLL